MLYLERKCACVVSGLCEAGLLSLAPSYLAVQIQAEALLGLRGQWRGSALQDIHSVLSAQLLAALRFTAARWPISLSDGRPVCMKLEGQLSKMMT